MNRAAIRCEFPPARCGSTDDQSARSIQELDLGFAAKPIAIRNKRARARFYPPCSARQGSPVLTRSAAARALHVRLPIDEARLSSASARAFIPLLKRIGFLSSDGA